MMLRRWLQPEKPDTNEQYGAGRFRQDRSEFPAREGVFLSCWRHRKATATGAKLLCDLAARSVVVTNQW
jgi:hypothetical protein